MLKKVITQLSPEEYDFLFQELNGNRAEKFSKLLSLYREGQTDDTAIRENISINAAAFYALKSRLGDKVQEYLFKIANDNRGDLLKNISSIPYLVHHTPRETGIILLQHLESELIKADMPRELISVYNGLKKLHLHSEQYYHYQQLYNKSVAYTLAVDKADELVCSFNQQLSEYLLSGDKSKLDILGLYLKELRHLNKLYDSHRLKSYLYLASLSYCIFTDIQNGAPETEETTEELLKKLLEILQKGEEDRQYKFLLSAWHFLNFEYYFRLSLFKNSAPSYEAVNQNIPLFLLLGHSCPAPQFLISKIEYCIRNNKKDELLNDFEKVEIIPNKLNPFEFISYSIYAAANLFLVGKFQEASGILNNCLNEISFKNYVFAEFQIKLFQTLILLLAGKTELAEIIFRSVSRKLQSEDYPDQFPNAIAFSKFLKIVINDNSSSKLKKLKDAYSSFSLINTGEFSLLKFAPLNEDHLQVLAK